MGDPTRLLRGEIVPAGPTAVVLVRYRFSPPAACPRGSPPTDVLEVEDAFLLHAELPGVPRESIELHAEGSRLVLAGRREPPAEAVGFLRMERSYGVFRRVFDFPSPVDAGAVSARFEHGVLVVTVPKERSGRSIPVKEGR